MSRSGARPDILLPAILALALGVAGCTPPAEHVPPDQLRSTVPGATAIVIVYSRSGHTARMARALAQALGADYLRILGRGGEGDGYFSTPSWTGASPTIPDRVDLSPYRLVLIGGPVWYWHPNALTTSFLRRCDLRGRDVVLFYTFEGGTLSASTEATWRQWVTARGGTVRDLFGIDRSRLPAGRDVASEATRLAQERRGTWVRQGPP